MHTQTGPSITRQVVLACRAPPTTREYAPPRRRYRMAVGTEVVGAGAGARVTNLVIDSDGHVQEQLTLPPDLMAEVMERIGADLAALSISPANDPFPME